MLQVTISLIPALLGAIYFFGIRAFYVTGFSVAVCVLTEYLWQKLTKKQVTAGDFSAVVTGILVLPDYQTEESPCIRCGCCEQVCPAGLIP